MSDESSDDSFVSADEGSDFEAETVPMPPKLPSTKGSNVVRNETQILASNAQLTKSSSNAKQQHGAVEGDRDANQDYLLQVENNPASPSLPDSHNPVTSVCIDSIKKDAPGSVDDACAPKDKHDSIEQFSGVRLSTKLALEPPMEKTVPSFEVFQQPEEPGCTEPSVSFVEDPPSKPNKRGSIAFEPQSGWDAEDDAWPNGSEVSEAPKSVPVHRDSVSSKQGGDYFEAEDYTRAPKDKSDQFEQCSNVQDDPKPAVMESMDLGFEADDKARGEAKPAVLVSDKPPSESEEVAEIAVESASDWYVEDDAWTEELANCGRDASKPSPGPPMMEIASGFEANAWAGEKVNVEAKPALVVKSSLESSKDAIIAVESKSGWDAVDDEWPGAAEVDELPKLAEVEQEATSSRRDGDAHVKKQLLDICAIGEEKNLIEIDVPPTKPNIESVPEGSWGSKDDPWSSEADALASGVIQSAVLMPTQTIMAKADPVALVCGGIELGKIESHKAASPGKAVMQVSNSWDDDWSCSPVTSKGESCQAEANDGDSDLNRPPSPTKESRLSEPPAPDPKMESGDLQSKKSEPSAVSSSWDIDEDDCDSPVVPPMMPLAGIHRPTSKSSQPPVPLDEQPIGVIEPTDVARATIEIEVSEYEKKSTLCFNDSGWDAPSQPEPLSAKKVDTPVKLAIEEASNDDEEEEEEAWDLEDDPWTTSASKEPATTNSSAEGNGGVSRPAPPPSAPVTNSWDRSTDSSRKPSSWDACSDQDTTVGGQQSEGGRVEEDHEFATAATTFVKSVGGGLANFVEGFKLANLSSTLSVFDERLEQPAAAPSPTASSSGAGQEGHLDAKSESGWGVWNWGSLAKSLSSTVENTGMTLLHGGVDVLETIGRKTFTALKENDPGLSYTKLFLQPVRRNQMPKLSQLLREASAEHDLKTTAQSSGAGASRAPRTNDPGDLACQLELRYATVHMEALELLSSRASARLSAKIVRLEAAGEDAGGADDYRAVCSLTRDGGVLEQIWQILHFKKEPVEVEQSEGGRELPSMEDTLAILNEVAPVAVLKKAYSDLDENTREVNPQFTINETFNAAVGAYAEVITANLAYLHKLSECLLARPDRVRTGFLDVAEKLAGVLTIAKKHNEAICSTHIEHLKKMTQSSQLDELTVGRRLVANLFLESSSANGYLGEAAAYLIPIIQLACVNSLFPDSPTTSCR